MQFRYNPAVLNIETIGLPAERIPGTQKPSTGLPLFPMPKGLVPLSPPELFDSQNLSDKIDGKAELYLTAGFVSLQTRRFKSNAASNLWLEVFIYDMGTGQNAFSVFSAQRREGAEPLNLTQYSYRTENALFLVHGHYYLEIIASEASEDALQPMELYSKAFIDTLEVETKSVTEENLFPKPDLVDNSISLISSDAFGFNRLDQVFTAVYKLGDTEVMAFLSHRKTDREAAELAQDYQEFLIAFGGRHIEIDLSIDGAKMVDILDTYEVIFSQGPYLAGVREAQDRNHAKELAIRLYNKLKQN
ncbi:MAG: hypothetical protein JSV31_29195 [Desulfobacterales bacterium]|nr:MAG: hypothetical protein JSV31_29195 [Desulfobacterales bacterium]